MVTAIAMAAHNHQADCACAKMAFKLQGSGRAGAHRCSANTLDLQHFHHLIITGPRLLNNLPNRMFLLCNT